MHIETKALKRDYHRAAYPTIHKEITVVERTWKGVPIFNNDGTPKTAVIMVKRRGPRRIEAPSLREFACAHKYGAGWLSRKGAQR